MNKARAFNPFLCAKTDKLLELIEEVQTQMSGYEAFYQTRKRARRANDQVTYDRTVEAILCDLCAVATEATDHNSVHLPLSNKTLRTKSRYKGTALGKTLPDILNIMAAPEMDFVVVEKGHSSFRIVDDELNVAFAGGQQTIVQPGPKLLSRIERFSMTRGDIGPAPEEEVILLRAPKRHSNSIAEYEEYEDDHTTLALRDQMIAINAWLEEADISCSHPDVNLAHRRLRRIFNNSDFAQGGRLYGGFWQAMSSDERQEHIRINQDTVVELDYGQMSLMILYGLTGHTPPEGDLYDLSAEGFPATYRKGIKKVIQAVINSSKVPTRMPGGVRKHIPSSYSIQDILKAVERKHSAIFAKMTSGIGMQLFRKEADILVDVLIALKAKGVVALPIHDAVLVADADKDTTIRIMKEVFKDYSGLTPQVTLG